MSITAHLDAIEEKRQLIKSQIEEEMHRPMPDFQLISKLKKHNMKLKEEAMACYEQRRASSA